MDVVGAESSSPFSTTIEISAQRKSRQLLIHIETLYRILLKLEDLENPIAIATSLIVKVTVTRTNFIEKLRRARPTYFNLPSFCNPYCEIRQRQIPLTINETLIKATCKLSPFFLSI